MTSSKPTPKSQPHAAEPPPSDAEIAKAWPRFRGPGGLGISAYTNVPDAWDAASGKGIVWKTPVPLPGNNSPVVWGKRVFLSGADKHRREVYCFDADSGKLVWRQNVPGTPQSTAKPPEVTDDTGYAAPTTATDGRRVFAIFANGDLAAFDVSGKPAWAKSLGIPENSYGHASSLDHLQELAAGAIRSRRRRSAEVEAAGVRFGHRRSRLAGRSARAQLVVVADRRSRRRPRRRSSRRPTRGSSPTTRPTARRFGG